MKTQKIKILIGLFTLTVAVVIGSACGSGKTATQNTQSSTVSVRPTETPTPEWKQQKRVSKDVINTETKNEPTKIKTKN